MLVNVLVISRLDFCNCLLYGIPKYQRDKLQRIQNTAARLVIGVKLSGQATPILVKTCIGFQLKIRLNLRFSS